VQFHILSFEGPDPYARAGGIASRVTGLSQSLADAGFATHLWFVGDPARPGHETHDALQLHRWCQWISRYHPGGVYDGEEGKRADYAASLPPVLCQEVLLPHLHQGGRAVILAEEWHTVDAVLHLDWLLRQAGVRPQVTLFWNANNTFAFERIEWARLAQAAVITTVSRYMKHLMWAYGVDPLVIPNGVAADAFVPPAREAVAAFRERTRGRTVVSKMARWDPDKRWLLAIATVGTMQQAGWRPLLIARGGVEAHGSEVLGAAAAWGLRVVERIVPEPGVWGLLHAVEGLHDADIVSLRSPLDAASRQLLLHSSHAVLANSGREPFGLVGLETMAAGGVACTGCSGEDYAVPGRNALVLETTDPQEFLNLYGALRANPAQERALRRAGRATAHQYRWAQIIRRVLVPRLHCVAGAPASGWTYEVPSPHGEDQLRLHIESHSTPLAPHLLGTIAEHLRELQVPCGESIAARVTVRRTECCSHSQTVGIELLLGGKTIRVSHEAATPEEAAQGALHVTAQQLRHLQTQRQEAS
jgi:glycosyltransferase involved in cell wall biosynthesis